MTRILFGAGLALCLLAEAANCQIGQWSMRFNHPTSGGFPSTFEAIDLALIPGVTTNPNDVVIAWDNQWHPVSSPVPWAQRFTVGDPEAGAAGFTNFTVTIPLGPNGAQDFHGDLFCSGHCWLPDGRLFVAGGNTRYGTQTVSFLGSRFVGIWDPAAPRVAPDYGWDFSLVHNSRVLRLLRWYPTVTLISRNLVMVSGGSSDTALLTAQQDLSQTTYEVFDLFTGNWVRDPANPTQNMLFACSGGTAAPSPALSQYPRLHLTSTNRVFLSGPWQESAYVVNAGSPSSYQWTDGMLVQSPLPPGTGAPLDSAASVLVPNVGMTPGLEDVVMAIGGGHWNSSTVVGTSQSINLGVGAPAWGNLQSMMHPRMVGNAVLCPTGEIVMIGGSANHYFRVLNSGGQPRPVLSTEVWDQANGWQSDAIQASPRMYHSTAALLPTGSIVSAGGDIRTYDWEIYNPRNMFSGAAPPLLTGPWASPGRIALHWGTSYDIDYRSPDGELVSHAVLMRPGSTTHHSDMDQRYVELQTVHDPSLERVRVTTPAGPTGGSAVNSVRTLPGYHLLFLVTKSNAVSMGKWVYLP